MPTLNNRLAIQPMTAGGAMARPAAIRFFVLLLACPAVVAGAGTEIATSLGRTIDRPAAAAASSRSEADRSRVQCPAPRISARLPAPQRFALTAAFKTAYRRTRESESCRGLFEGLELDATGALGSSYYDLPASAAIQARCQGRVGAVTGVRSHRTRLCPTFGTLSRNDRAAILIHEALHTAGLSEWPHDLDAPTSREITERVKRACSL